MDPPALSAVGPKLFGQWEKRETSHGIIPPSLAFPLDLQADTFFQKPTEKNLVLFE